MKTSDMKLLWNSFESNSRKNHEITRMMQEKRHPVLKEIKKQIITELSGWSIFLICYYSMFDGSAKPVYVNLVLIITVITPFVHNLYGYKLATQVASGENLIVSLKQHLARIQIYALQSIISRVIFSIGLLFFFTYDINFSLLKSAALAGLIAALVIIQIIIHRKMWQKRINSLKLNITELEK